MASMRAIRFRVRTLMAAVGLMAVLLWAVIMGFRSFIHYSLAREYSFKERRSREQAANDRFPPPENSLEFADFCAQMVVKHRRTMWRPWLPVAPDPPFWFPRSYWEELRREAAKSHAGP